MEKVGLLVIWISVKFTDISFNHKTQYKAEYNSKYR